jgi:hypothetical protein
MLTNRKFRCLLFSCYDTPIVPLAQELDLEKITSTNDYEISQVNRRTITENGVTQVVCEIGQVSIWSSDIKLLPNIEHCDILIYLLKKCDWNDDRLKLYKKYNGYALFCAGHVSDVYNCAHFSISINQIQNIGAVRSLHSHMNTLRSYTYTTQEQPPDTTLPDLSIISHTV